MSASPREGLELVRRSAANVAAEEEPLLNVVAVSRWLGVRPKRVYELGIASVRLSTGCIRWRRSDVQAWIESRRSAA